MSRFEKLREEISLIYEKAAAQKEALERAKEEEKWRLAAEVEEPRLAEENWLSVKGPVLEMLQELNREALNGEGQVIGWERKVTGVHTHTDEGSGGIESYPIGYSCKAVVEVAELQIAGIGKVVVFKTIKYQSNKYEKDFTNRNEPIMRKRVYIGVFTPQKEKGKPKTGDEYEVPCPTCEDVSALSLIQPSDELLDEIEGTFSAKLVYLYEVALLK